jgi:DUF2934 family protein
MLTAPPIGAAQTAEPHADTDEQARDEVERMIAEAAYFISAQRGFEPGHELDDWLAAEAQVLDQLAERR